MLALLTTKTTRCGQGSCRLSFQYRVFLLIVTPLFCGTLGQRHVSAQGTETQAVSHRKLDIGGVMATKSDLDPLTHNQTRELQLTIEEKEALTLNMDQASRVGVNFTLYCSHPSVRYSIRLETENSNVAVVDSDFQLFNISCAEASLRSGSNSGPSGRSSDPVTKLNSGEVAGTTTSENSGPTERNSESESGNSVAREVSSGSARGELLDAIPVVQGGFNFTLHADLLGRTWLHVYGQRHADADAVLPLVLVLPWNSPKPMYTSPSQPPSFKDHGSQSTPTNASFSGDADPEVSDVPYEVVGVSDKPEDDDEVVVHELQKHVVTVKRVIRPMDRAFRGILYGFIILSTVGMGCKTEIQVVKGVLRKPIAPAIGFFCQYLFMPLIAFMLAKTLTVGDPAVSLGIFACGVCPGGGVSNMYSYLLDGDVSLSVTMTAISSISALAMIPLWLFTLGAQFEDDKISLTVPFGKIFMTLCVIIVPLFIGIAIKRCLPKVAKWILKILTPFSLVALLFLVTFGVYTNLYVFRLFSARTLMAACLLPYIGYTLGIAISLLFRQPCYRVKTIAIETGIQNTSIAYLLLIFSLPDPDGDMAAVGPMASALMTPLPLVVVVIVYLLYKRFFKKEKAEKEGGEGVGGGEEGVALREGEGQGVGVDVRNGNVPDKGEKPDRGKGSPELSGNEPGDKEEKGKEKKRFLEDGLDNDV